MSSEVEKKLKLIGKVVTKISEDSKKSRLELVDKGGGMHYTVRKVRE